MKKANITIAYEEEKLFLMSQRLGGSKQRKES